MHKGIVALSKLLQKTKKSAKEERNKLNIEKVNEEVDKINREYGLEIGYVEEGKITDLEEWCQLTKKQWQALRIAEKIEEDRCTKNKINTAVDRRCERIDGEVGRMLSSILDKPYNKIRIDRVLKQKEDRHVLISKPSAVLEQTKEHFSEQFKKKNVIVDEEIIEEFYKPLAEVREEWYEELKAEITIEEWIEATGETKNKTALGMSNIGYKLIKSASVKTQEVFRKVADTCLKLGKIPYK